MKLLVVGSEANDEESRTQTAREFDMIPAILPEPLPNRGLVAKLRWAFDSRYTNLHGFAASPKERARLDLLLADFDLIWVLNARTPNLLQRWSWPKSHLDVDDLPSTYLRSQARNGTRLGTRLRSSLQQRLFYRRELRFRERFNTLSVCSRDDKAYLGGGEEIHVIPNGFERPIRPPPRRPSPNSPRLGFIGLYSYAPNLEGVRWFLTECWPAIRRTVPDIRLRLIGRETDGPLKPKESDVDALGWLQDPTEEIATWSAMIVPIRFGGGTRIKIAEAFSRKCPTVSTTIGAFGYEVKHGEHILIADSAREYVDACVSIVRKPELARHLAENAWSAYLEEWTWDAIATKVRAAANACLATSCSPASGFSNA